VEEILEYKDKIEKDWMNLNNEEIVNKLNEELLEEDGKLYRLAKEMNNERVKASKLLEEKSARSLKTWK